MTYYIAVYIKLCTHKFYVPKFNSWTPHFGSSPAHSTIVQLGVIITSTAYNCFGNVVIMKYNGRFLHEI